MSTPYTHGTGDPVASLGAEWLNAVVVSSASAPKDGRFTSPWPETFPVAVSVMGGSVQYALCLPTGLWRAHRDIVVTAYTSTPQVETSMLAAVMVMAVLRRLGWDLGDVQAVVSVAGTNEVAVRALAGFLAPLTVTDIRNAVMGPEALRGTDIYAGVLAKAARL